jgi:hypothetical protein
VCPAQIEFEPSLDVDVVHAPRGWRDPDLFTSAPDFMEAMRPLLDTYLAAQGERPLQDMEWQVRQHARLAHASAFNGLGVPSNVCWLRKDLLCTAAY